MDLIKFSVFLPHKATFVFLPPLFFESKTDTLKTLYCHHQTPVDTVYNSIEYLVTYTDMVQLPTTKSRALQKFTGYLLTPVNSLVL